jgi:osmotically-inducible protein OsmY
MAQQPMMKIEAAQDFNVDQAVVDALESLDMVRETRAPITVSVARGVVTLSGIVISESMKRAVLVRVATTPGVVKVIDNLYEDPKLRLAAASALAGDPATGPGQPSITITCYLGMVTLTGPALPDEVQSKAKEIIASIPGVREVFVRFGR